MSLSEAIEMVRLGQAQRIATPGQWVVWSTGGAVKHELLNSNSVKANN